MGFPAILSALQPFQICIYNRKYSKLTFSNGSHLMGKRFMANLHASLEKCTCKSRIYKISTRFRTRGIHSTTFDAELRNVGFPFFFYGVSWYLHLWGFLAILSALQPFQICIYNWKYSKLTFSHGSHLMGKRFMANLHASFESTCKSRIYKISTRSQN